MALAFKGIFALAVLSLGILTGYGYLVDMAPAPAPVTQSVVLNAP